MNLYDPFYDFTDQEITAESLGRPNDTTSTAWMLTVADLFSLMLTFFVLLYSMSSLDKERWHPVSQSMQNDALEKPLIPAIAPIKPQPLKTPQEILPQGRGLDYLFRILSGQLKDQKELKEARITLEAKAVRIALATDAMYAPGSANMQEAFLPAIRKLADILGRIDNQLSIEGFTDNTPIHTASFPSNWELSLARAANVAQQLRAVGYPHPLLLYGHGSTGGRHPSTMDRRVEIVLRERAVR